MKISITILTLFFNYILMGQNEAHYIDILATQLSGVQEYKVKNGRVDIVTPYHAIEVEWAANWKHSIGQALWYGLQTNKKPGIILIMKETKDRNFGVMLKSALDYAGIGDKIDVWFYPEDFGSSITQVTVERAEYKQTMIQNNGNYTRNKNSGVRHNSNCSYFDCANCIPCGPADGKKACGKCGG